MADVATAKSIYDSVSFITNSNIAASIIDGGYRDATDIKAIADALVDIQIKPVAQVLAAFGIKDPALANQLANIVSKIDDIWDAADILSQGNGSPTKTQKLVNKYTPATETLPTVVAGTGSGSSGSSSSGSSNPANISLIETCTTWAPVTF